MFRHFFYALLLLSFFSSTAFSQKKIFEDDFKNNKNGWKLRNDTNFLVDIKNGVLHIQKFQKNFVSRGCLWYNKKIDGLNTLNDFSITLYAKFISGGDIFDWMDFQWGNSLQPKDPLKRKTVTNGLYQLSFITTGEIKLDYFDNSWSYFVRKNIKTLLGEKFDPKKINKYEIVQKDSLVIFKVNDKEVLKHFCNPIAGNSIGFQQCLKTEWEIDRIVIRQEKKKITASKIVSLPPVKSSDINYTTDKELKVYPNPFNHDLYVNVYLEKEETVRLFLIDMSGTTLQQHQKQLGQGVQNIRLYADVPSGAYILKMQIGNKVLTATVIKQ
jgi:hypothetical protein